LFYIKRFNRTLARMKNTVVTFLLLLSVFGFCQTKSQVPELIDKIIIDADVFIGYDKFDYLYFVKNNVLHKVKNGESFEYKNLALGQITKVDLLNPLKVIVFYERFNTVVTLDNQLNETLKIDFSQIKIPLVVGEIGIASQNQLWVFDEISQQLYLYDTINGTLITVGTPLSAAIVFYNSDFNTFEWLDKSNQFYQCTIFGTVRELSLPFEFDTILFTNNELIIYKKDEKIIAFGKKTSNFTLLENSTKSFENLTYKSQILSIFTKEGISNFKITIP
jgi:hypothetical protein